MSSYRFGEFTLDLNAFALRRHGTPIRLERRAFDLLAMLVRQPGRLVPRDEIIAALWPPGVIIDFDAGLNTLVRKVRAALGDSPDEPRFVETVPGRGYRFIAHVELETPPIVAAGGPGTAAPRASEAAPTGVVSAEARTAVSLAAQRPRRASVAIALATVIAAVGAIAWWQRPSEPVRIAVLPFENLANDTELAYLATGLAEDTSISLARVDPDSLRVVGVAARVPADATGTPAELGRRLGVDLLVRSSLRREGTRIRVAARLLRVRDGEQLWSAAFDRELTQVLGLQRELSTAIAEQIRLRLSPDVAAAIRRRQTENPAAYALYLQGRYEWSRLTRDSTRRALDLYSRATAVDPTYGLAWAEMAFAAASSLRAVDADPAVAIPLARRALERALALGPDLVETQYAAGYVRFFCDLDRRSAEQAGRAAIRLDPNNSQAHMLLGVSLVADGQITEAREMLRRARELDPFFALAFANSALVALAAAEPDAALELARQSVAIDPDLWVGHFYVGRALAALGNDDGAAAAYATAGRLSDGHSLVYRARAELLVRQRRIDAARELLTEMYALDEQRYFSAYAIAGVHALLEEREPALRWLERAVERRDVSLSNLATERAFAMLRNDPGFQDVLRRCGCTEVRTAARR